MALVEQAPAAIPVQRVAPGLVAVGAVEHRRSVLVSTERVLPDWPVRDPGAIDAAAIDLVLSLRPDVLLLGTGERLVFPPPHVGAAFLTRGIGFEVMDNGAAARTYTVLAAEGRRVVAAFIIGGGEP